MPTLSYPGVYVEEIPSGVRPLEIASTSTAAFVGLAEMGPEDATRVTSWTEFQRYFGSFIADSYLPNSVFQYFNNGGRQCYIVRVTRTDAAVASVTVQNRAETPVNGLTISAKNKGGWGNYLYLQIDDSVPAANTSLQHGVHRGGFEPTLPLDTKLSLQVNVDGDGFQVVTLPAAAGASTNLGDVATAITTAVQGLTKKKTSTADAAFTGFACTVDTVNGQSRLVLQSGTTSPTSSVRVQPAATNDATAQLKLGPGNGGQSEDGLAVRRPVKADVVQIGDAAVAAPVAAATPGSDGTAAVSETTFSGAFSRLDNVTDFSLLAVPGEGTTTMMDLGMAYCANRPLQDIFYLGEMASHDDTAADAGSLRNKLTTANSYGALYFPFVKARDPSGQSCEPTRLSPDEDTPGLYARIDASRGVWKAPAGTEASLNGVVGLAVELSDVQQGNLNPVGVDVIRRFPAAGIVAFGARTISSDPEWKYVPVRRTAIMLRVSIYYGIQWAVFEPNDESLWSQLRLNIGSFMMTLFRQGAFQGSTPSQAFFVKCDAETTTQADIDLGVVNILVGFAPLKPAEFVVVKISQKAGQASA